MAAASGGPKRSWRRWLGCAIAVGGGVVVAAALPGWVWLLAAGLVLVWLGLLVAMGHDGRDRW